MKRCAAFTWLLTVILMGCGDESGIGPAGDEGAIDAAADAVVDVAPLPDTHVEDTAAPDEGVADEGLSAACEPGDGCFGEGCDSAQDCLSGICTTHMGDKVCSRTCDETCPLGWSCTLVGFGGDGQYVCMSDASHLCLPCMDAGTCSGETPNACVRYADGMSFCGSACDLETPCPSGYSCQEVETTEGADSYQCVSTAGVCPCSNLAIASALATSCTNTGDLGTCKGVRICEADGLSDCSAVEAVVEICNGVDDDCDGVTDEATCDDGNDCTLDTCEADAGCTTQTLDEGECLDGDACTIGDHCEAGVCVGKTIDCEDGNPCTLDSCDGLGGCKSEDVVALCDDGQPCTLGDICQEGVCAGSAELSCDDSNPCTEDSCGEAGCVFTANAAECDDGNACTSGDGCSGGACQGATINCDDANLCTTDGCDVATGCVNVDNAQPCDDGDTCSLGDLCGDGACGAGPNALECVDASPCTDDGCDAAAGCVFLPNALDCDDKNECTTQDACVEGACIGAGSLACDDGNPCTVDSCLPGGGCDHQVSAGACDDGDPCTVNDSCADGGCVSGLALSCDDGNPCTDEVCQGGDCVFTLNDAACDDANACTAASACSSGACVGEGSVNCDDGNDCTSEGCDPETGCVNENNQLPCSDGSVCTLGDLCGDGSCQPGEEALNCEDGNSCTDDACDAALGCTFSANQLDCDDGNACSSGDTCVDKLCVAKGNVNCADGNPCTDDICDVVLGCQTILNEAPCDDGDSCTVGDSCGDGVCQTGPDPLQCDDDLFCNGEEGCDAELGCVAGVAPPVDDGVDCTVDVCDGVNGAVVHTPDSGQCDLPPGASCQIAVCDVEAGCQIELQAECCGNGIVEDGEDCDGGPECPGSCQLVSSCKELLAEGESQDGVYLIDPDGAGGAAPFKAYCDLNKLEGGWTLVLMTKNGDHETFKYQSSHWTSSDALNADTLDPSTDENMKSPAYATLGFTSVRLDLVNTNNAHVVNVTKGSALELFNGPSVGTPYDRADFLNWVPEDNSHWNNQPCCNIKGIQASGSESKCRYGIIMNNECNECTSADSAVGFGCYTNDDCCPSVRRISSGAFRWNSDVRYSHRGWIWVR